MEALELLVEKEEYIRIDLYLANRLDKFSRTYLRSLIKEGLISVNGRTVKPKYLIKKGDLIQIKLPPINSCELKAENLPLDIIYEDEDIGVVNKAKGMVVHPAFGNMSGTLVNALLFHMDRLAQTADTNRPGIVHRLDKDTSGLLVVAKSDRAYRSLIEQFRNRSIKREYLALVHGVMSNERATINAPLGRDPIYRKRMTIRKENGKEAITHFRIIERYKEYTLIRASLETGRTHQIRVHMAYIRHPIVGDCIYGKRKNEFFLYSQFLYAVRLGFIHPNTGKYIEFDTKLPVEFQNILEILKER